MVIEAHKTTTIRIIIYHDYGTNLNSMLIQVFFFSFFFFKESKELKLNLWTHQSHGDFRGNLNP